jgi:hypothetical protein
MVGKGVASYPLIMLLCTLDKRFHAFPSRRTHFSLSPYALCVQCKFSANNIYPVKFVYPATLVGKCVNLQMNPRVLMSDLGALVSRRLSQ